MAYPLTLPILGGLSIFGAAFGVWLGNSAVAEIDPIYFNDPETRFHADLVPYRSPDWARVQAAEFRQASQTDGYGDFCLGCTDYPEEVVPKPYRAPEGVEEEWTAAGYQEEVEAQPVAVETVQKPEWEQVRRYAAYPVTAVQAKAEPPPPQTGEQAAF